MRFSLPLVLILSACSSVVPSTAMRLSGLSPTTADPAGFAVDLALPAGIEIQPDSAMLMFSVTRSDTGETKSGAFVLERDDTVFRVARDDLPALRALQATAQQWDDAAGGTTSGSLGINLAPCLKGNGPDPDVRVSVGLRLDADGVFLPLVRNGPLSAVASPAQISEMSACP